MQRATQHAMRTTRTIGTTMITIEIVRTRPQVPETVVVPDWASRYCSQAGCFVKHISPR